MQMNQAYLCEQQVRFIEGTLMYAKRLSKELGIRFLLLQQSKVKQFLQFSHRNVITYDHWTSESQLCYLKNTDQRFTQIPEAMPPPTSPCCVYGNPCFSVCINQKCRKIGMICEKGYETKEQCYLFHQQCPQIKWSQLEKIATQNSYNSTQEFLQFKLKIERTFVKAIEKIRQEQEKFRIWVKTFGHSLEVMKFIKLINDQNYEEISGSLVAPVINSYFKQEANISRPPNLAQQQIRQIQQQIQLSIENITSLYLRSVKRKPRPQQQQMINTQQSSSSSQFTSDDRKGDMVTRNQTNCHQGRQRNESGSSGQKNADRYNQHQERLDGSQMSESNGDTPTRQQMMPKFNSKIYRHVEHIRKLFTHARPTAFKLLYRASENGFSIDEFHKTCDNVANTLVLVETEFGKVIGGFSALAWKSNKKQWVADKDRVSFIFSLSLNERYELNLPQFAISCNGDKGPIFGCCDICLVDKSNKEKSSAEFPISYNLNKKYHRGDQASFAFTGHPKGQYKTKEWEVFKVQFE